MQKEWEIKLVAFKTANLSAIGDQQRNVAIFKKSKAGILILVSSKKNFAFFAEEHFLFVGLKEKENFLLNQSGFIEFSKREREVQTTKWNERAYRQNLKRMSKGVLI